LDLLFNRVSTGNDLEDGDDRVAYGRCRSPSYLRIHFPRFEGAVLEDLSSCKRAYQDRLKQPLKARYGLSTLQPTHLLLTIMQRPTSFELDGDLAMLQLSQSFAESNDFDRFNQLSDFDYAYMPGRYPRDPA